MTIYTANALFLVVVGNITWEKRSSLKGADEAFNDFYGREQQVFFESLERCLVPGCHNIGFRTKGGLTSHKKTNHEGADVETRGHPFKCMTSECKKSFKNLNMLRAHRERAHLGLVYRCRVCNFLCVDNLRAGVHASMSGHNMDGFEKIKDIYWED